MRSVIAILLAGCASSPGAGLPLGATSEDCASCHEEHAVEHRASPHARSDRSPLLAAMLPEVEARWGAFARDRCVGCHAPEHAPEHTPGESAIGCVSCHAAAGNHAERDGELAIDLGAPLAGPFGDAAPTPAHGSRAYGFLASDSLCGTCHELTGPNLVREPTLTEFRASPQAQAGMTCIDCHAPPSAPRPLAPGERDRPVRDHRFAGVDPPYGASPEEAARAAEDARALLASALSLEVEHAGEAIEIVVRNVGAAHGVPTGATFLRDLWVDVEVGEVVTAHRILRIGDQPTHMGVPVALLTRADAVAVASLPPGGAARARVAQAHGVAILRARAVRHEVLDDLGVPELAREIPTHDVLRVSW